MDYTLEKLSSFSGPQGPLLLIIMDGLGIGKKDQGDAVFLANPQNLIKLEKECKERALFTTIKAHGPAVGLPSEEDQGNSEVGHNAIGAGRIYNQGAKLVNEDLKTGRIFGTRLWEKLTSKVKGTDNCVHLIGLLSDGNVHSNIHQLYGILDGLVESGVNKVRIHILLDGRDVPEKSALSYVHPLENKLKLIQETYNYDYRIASGGGRMYVTMDRYESDWNVVKRGWYTHVLGIVQEIDLVKGYKGYYQSTEEAITHGRDCFPETNDQTARPFVVVDEQGQPVGKIYDGDVVINFNFRGDRAIQISKAFEEEEFDKFDRIYYPDVEYAGLLEYDDEAHIPEQYLVQPPDIKHTLSDFLCAQKVSQFAIAETHKFGHVTYFWNGNRTGYVCPDLEKYMEIKSDPSEMIPKQPKMKAYEVLKKTLEVLDSLEYKFIRVNFANPDMVGHTGLIDATIIAVQTVDECVAELVKKVNELNGITIITADHGNAEEMLQKDGSSSKTSHTTNPVGFWIIDKNWDGEYKLNFELEDPGLTNITSTIINLLGYNTPEIYRKSLVRFRE
ncbi:MAG: 2,3-bisphosphoglycerate-independent phosphoglycerate mutase [Candidatus Lokiarchaeota archaeon]|nr:2,3-bisphosphoglycerate-independent phosphoglycerate mutase [Candidatus Lokiarchaeota archaeon]